MLGDASALGICITPWQCGHLPFLPAAESGAPEAASTAGEAASAGAATSESAVQQPAAEGEAVTLRIKHWNEQMVDQNAWWTEVLDGYIAQHPNVTIDRKSVV